VMNSPLQGMNRFTVSQNTQHLSPEVWLGQVVTQIAAQS
jgi:hypothetical protein